MVDILAPVSGVLKPIDEVKDKVFSERMLGDGVAIHPFESMVYAPCDGFLTSIYPDGHAFVIEQESIRIMVHIGIDTFELEGECFENLRKEGDKIFAGDPIVEVDYDYMSELGYSTDTMIVVMDKPYIPEARACSGRHVEVEDLLFKI